MNREEFMRQLERLLWEIPVNDREDAIAYYQDYFDEAGAENEEKVIKELGSPERVAAVIKADRNRYGTDLPYVEEQIEYTESGYSDAADAVNREMLIERDSMKKANKKSMHWVGIFILLVLASPMILGLGAGVIGTLIGILAALAGVLLAIVLSTVGVLAGGIVCFAVGIFRLFANPLEGLVTTGVGAILTAVGILLTLLCVWLIGKWIPALVKICINFCKKILHRNERRTV
ncbi:MAG: DUF1700 domain-containing protein [Ruminococcus sp.]|nr:DUF1700 domain-containing protein [Ruminococcus sp.]